MQKWVYMCWNTSIRVLSFMNVPHIVLCTSVPWQAWLIWMLPFVFSMLGATPAVLQAALPLYLACVHVLFLHAACCSCKPSSSVNYMLYSCIIVQALQLFSCLARTSDKERVPVIKSGRGPVLSGAHKRKERLTLYTSWFIIYQL